MSAALRGLSARDVLTARPHCRVLLLWLRHKVDHGGSARQADTTDVCSNGG